MFYLKARAFQNFVRSYRKDLVGSLDPLTVLTNIRDEIIEIIEAENSRIRFIVCMCITFEKLNDDEVVYNEFYFSSGTERLLSNYELNEKLNSAYDKILNGIDDFLNYGSGWQIKNVNYVEIHIGRYYSQRGGCKHVSLPKLIRNKKAVLNINSDTNMCFINSVLAGLFPQKRNKNLESTYMKFRKHIAYEFLRFPVKISQISNFERINKLKINVYGYKHNIFPIYRSKFTYSKELDLLMYRNHYFLIKSFNRLLHEKHGIHKFCKNCLLGFARQSTLDAHEQRCLKNAPQKITLPNEYTKFLKFTAWQKLLFHPFCLYADFECLTKKVCQVEPNEKLSYSMNTQIHKPACYSLVLIDDKRNIVYHKAYFGEDSVENFILSLKAIEKCILDYLKTNIPIKNENVSAFEHACHLCGKRFAKLDTWVRNHDHLSGEMLGKACQGCNLNYKLPFFVPVVMHNLRGYDSHLILQKISSNFANRVKVIAVNSEKCTTFNIDNLRFLDSFLFLPSKLSDLVQNLKDSNYAFPIFNSFFSSVKHKSLLLRKGVFPYSYFDSFDVLEEKRLPQKKHFFNELTNTHISDDDFNFANMVFSKLKCSSFKDYLFVYLNTDVVLLADVFENFRRLSMEYFELDPVHFYTTPSLTWSAGLKTTKVELELLTDIDMYLMFESGIRGGMCLVSNRYAQANNKYIKKFDPSTQSSFIISLDVNNLYGHAMASNKLPESKFRWLSAEEIQNFDVQLISHDSDIGYVLDVDLVYPDELHDAHNSFPLAPSHDSVSYNMLSDYQRTCLKSLNMKQNKRNVKLLNTLYDKKNYVVHILNLQFYLKHGIKIEKINRIIEFRQSFWLKPYILFNNDRRKKAQNTFDKQYFKLMNNAFFGRTCMNIRKHVNVKVALNENQCAKYLADSGLDFFSILNESSVLFKSLKSNLYLNQPIFVGFSILELSKLYMFHLYYDVFKPVYGDKISLLYTDTDSLCMHVYTDDLYLDLGTKFQSKLDFSNYNISHFLYSKEHESALGYLKDETKGIPINEFCALRPKMYSYTFGNKK